MRLAFIINTDRIRMQFQRDRSLAEGEIPKSCYTLFGSVFKRKLAGGGSCCLQISEYGWKDQHNYVINNLWEL